MRFLSEGLASLVLASLVAACGGEIRVARVVDGRVVWGEFVDSPSYTTFLKAALEEARGDRRGALADYELVAREGDVDPEVWTRIGGVLCDGPAEDPNATAAFDRALALDAEYGPAWEGKARCALRWGKPGEAASDARRAAGYEPLAVGPQVVLSTVDDAAGRSEAARARLVALTLAQGSTPAWEALAAWGRGHGDAALVAQALGRVSLLDPSRRAAIGEVAVTLAAEGALTPGRSLAAAVVDAPGDRSSGGLGPAAAGAPLVARLAIDLAIVAGDADRARARGARAHVGLDVVAARALLLGDVKLARALAEPALAAVPSDRGAAFVLSAARGALAAPEAMGPVAAEPLVVLAQALVAAGATSAALRLTRTTPHEPFVAGDPTLTPALVDLAAAGALDEAALPPEAAIELSGRRMQMPALDLLAKADARHRLFGLALARPLDPEAARLAKHLALSGARDPLVVVSLVRLALARGDAVETSVVDGLVKDSPADPLVLLLALDVAKKRGDEGAMVPARARLTAIARTPEERARARE